MSISLTVFTALAHFGNPKTLEHIYKQVMAKLCGDYERYKDHDTIYAVCLLRSANASLLSSVRS